jgi:hypothetical protein
LWLLAGVGLVLAGGLVLLACRAVLRRRARRGSPVSGHAGLPLSGVVLIVVALAGAGAFVASPALARWSVYAHEFHINTPQYERQNGHWDKDVIPDKKEINVIQAVLLSNGRVLQIAGSGNVVANFRRRTYVAQTWDPATGAIERSTLGSDLFCGGEVVLPDGKVLVMGGTGRYEVLATKVTHAGGVLDIRNYSPQSGVVYLKRGAVFLGPKGQRYRSREATTIDPASSWHVPSRQSVWIDAVLPGKEAVISGGASKVRVAALDNSVSRFVFGLGDQGGITLGKQEYGGIKAAYLFDPTIGRWARAPDMRYARWYPTAVELSSGNILVASGLDQFGIILQGENEVFNTTTNAWQQGPHLYLPTFPSLFVVRGDNVFYSGSTAGYGSTKRGRTPLLWNMRFGTVRSVRGLRQPNMTETSASVLLAPVQRQEVALIGGGGVGNAQQSASRIDIAELNGANPHYRPGTNLESGTRYPNVVTLPNDQQFITGGSAGYRGEGLQGLGNSDLVTSYLLSPGGTHLQRVADALVKRDYHSEALLLPDGRVIVSGGDPLKDPAGKNPGTFERAVSIYSPPYLFEGPRPEVKGGPKVLKLGQRGTFSVSGADDIAKVRLIAPGSATHVTDTSQRSVALRITRRYGDHLTVRVPTERDYLPPGSYMLFVVNREGVPSIARWVFVP